MENRDYLWLVLAVMLMEGLKILDYILFKGTNGHSSYFALFINSPYVVYALIGYYLENRVKNERLTSDGFFILLMLSVFAVCVTYALTE